jgi:hypothetical protein
MTTKTKAWFQRIGLCRAKAPTARQFLEAEGRNPDTLRSLSQAMDFAERYADFVAEFEREEGVLDNVERWPAKMRDPFKSRGRVVLVSG